MTGTDQTPEGVVADSARNWVDTWAPQAARPYLRLSRADRPIGTWLLYLPCLWGLALAILSSGPPDAYALWIAIGCGIGAFLMRGAGCTWNDITDRKIDAQVARTKSRPLPSGQVSLRGATIWMLLQMLIALCVLLTFPSAAIALGVAAVVPVAIYPFAKRFTWWPQVFLGIAFNWGILLAWTAWTGSLALPAVILYLAGIAWTLFYDTIYAHQDAEDDALIGVKSTALLFGDMTPRWLNIFLISCVFIMAGAVTLVTVDRSVLSLMIALIGPWLMGMHLWAQLIRFDPDNGPRLLAIFRSNREAGLIPLLFFTLAAFV